MNKNIIKKCSFQVQTVPRDQLLQLQLEIFGVRVTNPVKIFSNTGGTVHTPPKKKQLVLGVCFFGFFYWIF